MDRKARPESGAAPSRIFWLIVGCLLLAYGVVARAADHIVARAFYEDTQGLMTLAEASQQSFVPFNGLLSRGIGRSIVWIRLTIDPNHTGASTHTIQDEQLLLRLRPVYLDSIELFDPLDSSGRRRLTGDHYPIAADEVKSLLLGFLIPKGGQPRDVYLRIQSTSSRMLYAEAIPWSEYSDHGRPYQIATGLYLGFNLMFIVWALVMWAIGRERLILIYLVAQVAALLVGVTLTGYLRFFGGDWLPPLIIDRMTSVTVLLAVVSACWFYLTLLREFSPPRWGVWFLQSSFWLFGLELLLLLLDLTRIAILLNWMYLSVFPVLLLLMVACSRGGATDGCIDWPGIPRAVLLGYFSMLSGFYLINTLGGLGVFQISLISMYFGMINCFLSGILTLMLLQYRFVVNEKNNAQLVTQLRLSEQQIEQQRLHREDQESLLAMLAHEMKTSLSIITLALQTQNDRENNLKLAGAAVIDMRDIIDQCLEVDRFNDANLQLGLEAVKLASLLQDLQSKIPGLSSRLQIQMELGQLETDARLLSVIVLNLLNNAMRYSPPDTVITVKITAREGGMELRQENLPGIAGWPDPERLFQKYYRAPGAYRLSGTGLGLYLSRQMAQRLGGELRYVPSATHIGFVLWLPSKKR